MKHSTATNIRATMNARTQKTPRQPSPAMMAPPSTGARTGAMPPMIIIRPSSLAPRTPLAESAMMARDRTTPAAPLKPWMKRATMRNSMVGATAVAMLARRQTERRRSAACAVPCRRTGGR